MKYEEFQIVYVSKENVFTYGNVIEEDKEFVKIKSTCGAEVNYEHKYVFDNMDDAIADFCQHNKLKLG